MYSDQVRDQIRESCRDRVLIVEAEDKTRKGMENARQWRDTMVGRILKQSPRMDGGKNKIK